MSEINKHNFFDNRQVRFLSAAEVADCNEGGKPENFKAGWYHWEGDSDLTTGHWDYLQGPFDTEEASVEDARFIDNL